MPALALDSLLHTNYICTWSSTVIKASTFFIASTDCRWYCRYIGMVFRCVGRQQFLPTKYLGPNYLNTRFRTVQPRAENGLQVPEPSASSLPYCYILICIYLQGRTGQTLKPPSLWLDSPVKHLPEYVLRLDIHLPGSLMTGRHDHGTGNTSVNTRAGNEASELKRERWLYLGCMPLDNFMVSPPACPEPPRSLPTSVVMWAHTITTFITNHHWLRWGLCYVLVS